MELNGHADAARASDGEIGGVPLRSVGGKDAHTVTGFYAELDEGCRKSRDATEKFLRRYGFPTVAVTKHLRAGIRQLVNCIQESGREGAVIRHVFDCTAGIFQAQLRA